MAKITLVASVALIAVLAILELTNTTNFIKLSSKADGETTAKTTSDAPTAQEDFSDGDDRTPVKPNNSGTGTVADNQGGTSYIPDASQWTGSPNEELIVYTPTINSVLKNGDTLSGKATTDTVSFRLIDNVSGVIARGELSVVNGTFSGKFDFTTSATEGRLDVFNTGFGSTEYNNVEIPIKFK